MKIWLVEYAVFHHRPFIVKHSDENKCYVLTYRRGCPWTVHARKWNDCSWRITSVVQPHTCLTNMDDMNHVQLSSRFISQRLVNVIKNCPLLTVTGKIVCTKAHLRWLGGSVRAFTSHVTCYKGKETMNAFWVCPETWCYRAGGETVFPPFILDIWIVRGSIQTLLWCVVYWWHVLDMEVWRYNPYCNWHQCGPSTGASSFCHRGEGE
jgi:hypothetical protein